MKLSTQVKEVLLFGQTRIADTGMGCVLLPADVPVAVGDTIRITKEGRNLAFLGKAG